MRTTLVFSMIISFCSLHAQQYGQGFADLVAKVQDGVVHIETIGETRQEGGSRLEEFFGLERRQPQTHPQRGSGSGFIISPDGYIVTNRHVIAESKKVKVSLINGQTYEADVVGTDNSLDVALIKINTSGLTAFAIGNSDNLRIGDVLLAMGYPLQLGFSVTSGIVSGIGRNMRTGSMDLGTYIQTDADITFGNSGGPLLNSKGEVIGINTMIVTSGETYGFAIPSSLFMHSVEELKAHGEVRRGALGISVGELSQEAKEYYGLDHGALVAGVYDGFPAQKAGMKRDDVILEIDGKKVQTSQDVIGAVARKAPGDKVTLQILSDGKKLTRSFELGDRDKFSGASASVRPRGSEDEGASGLGFSARSLNDLARKQMGLDDDVEGLVVVGVEPGSMAEEKGLRPGTVITSVNKVPVTDLKGLEKILAQIGANRPVPLHVVEPLGRGETQERTLFLRKSQ